ncbi:hypothetical protein FOL47_010069 [Perkinsus chesapeaki]|uniref:Uncharacterized protein n=1 Tax=Perkinsus chesapeaki TaxID=330153 RepID=A0A7J6MRD6_PERCH|nr:hypothetical protein FOL47_010069 [Perkinsus chesapeaki]
MDNIMNLTKVVHAFSKSSVAALGFGSSYWQEVKKAKLTEHARMSFVSLFPNDKGDTATFNTVEYAERVIKNATSAGVANSSLVVEIPLLARSNYGSDDVGYSSMIYDFNADPYGNGTVVVNATTGDMYYFISQSQAVVGRHKACCAATAWDPLTLKERLKESKIPFGSSSKLVLDALKAFKIVKDKCFGLTREEGWKEAITASREAWVKTGLSWTLKAHIVCDHTQEFLEKFEPVAGAGLSLSSEQSGEALHARLQRVWNLRIRINPDNEQYGQRLVDCMVAYNWNLQWDEAARFKARANSTASHPYDDSSS